MGASVERSIRLPTGPPIAGGIPGSQIQLGPRRQTAVVEQGAPPATKLTGILDHVPAVDGVVETQLHWELVHRDGFDLAIAIRTGDEHAVMMASFVMSPCSRDAHPGHRRLARRRLTPPRWRQGWQGPCRHDGRHKRPRPVGTFFTPDLRRPQSRQSDCRSVSRPACCDDWGETAPQLRRWSLRGRSCSFGRRKADSPCTSRVGCSSHGRRRCRWKV